MVYDNSDLNAAYRQVAIFADERMRYSQEPIPQWFRPLVP
jgi:hypothetical protein